MGRKVNLSNHLVSFKHFKNYNRSHEKISDTGLVQMPPTCLLQVTKRYFQKFVTHPEFPCSLKGLVGCIYYHNNQSLGEHSLLSPLLAIVQDQHCSFLPSKPIHETFLSERIWVGISVGFYLSRHLTCKGDDAGQADVERDFCFCNQFSDYYHLAQYPKTQWSHKYLQDLSKFVIYLKLCVLGAEELTLEFVV